MLAVLPVVALAACAGNTTGIPPAVTFADSAVDAFPRDVALDDGESPNATPDSESVSWELLDTTGDVCGTYAGQKVDVDDCDLKPPFATMEDSEVSSVDEGSVAEEIASETTACSAHCDGLCSDGCGGNCEGQPCSDEDNCTIGDKCGQGKCLPGVALPCDDGNVCTDDSCTVGLGCNHLNNNLACEDGVSCTTGDHCVSGQCQASANCPCEASSDCAVAEDGDLCNGILYCDKATIPFSCKVNPKTVVACDPTGDTICHSATCDPKDGKCKPMPTNEGKPCDDGTACVVKSFCAFGTCAGASVTCDDGNVCTNDECIPYKGCTFAPNDDACADGDVCTVGDKCVKGACTGLPLNCDDGFACTLDSCDPTSGCVHTMSSDVNCGVVQLPYVNSFACSDSTLALWQRSGTELATGSVIWNFDATPVVPGFSSASCSLNVNNGSDLSCVSPQASVWALADSPWFDASKIGNVPIALRFLSAGKWGAGDKAIVLVRILGGSWTQIGVVSPSAAWQPVNFASVDWSGKKFQARLQFSGACGSGADTGWFVDDIEVAADPCAIDNGSCPQGTLCAIGTTGSVICLACSDGYEMVGSSCVDVDECAKPSACGANAVCTNKLGTYTCACPIGFLSDGGTCYDIDECAAGTMPCAAAAVCTNKPGSYVCTCMSGYAGNGTSCDKRGTQANPAASCLEILTFFGASDDGVYWLDFDGGGPLLEAPYVCDMKNGGWTRLISDTFDSGQVGGWVPGSVTTCGAFGKILGGYKVFGKGSVTSKQTSAPQHTEYKLSAKYLFVDSWDGEIGGLGIDGQLVWIQQHMGDVFSTSQCGMLLYGDSSADVNVSGGHESSKITVYVTSSLNESADNESFGVDNVNLWVR